MTIRIIRSLVCVACLALWPVSAIRADLPLCRLDRIFPLGGSTGSDVVIEIGGKDLDDVKSLHFDHPGLKAELIKPNQFRVKIAADVPPGTYDVRAVGTHGISGSRLFMVSRGLAEVLEKEPNDTPDKAQDVPMNAAINGRSDNNGDDFFRFPARKGERVTIDCQAFRLDSTLRASMSVATADGKELAQSKPYYCRTDPFLDFIAPADGNYIFRIHDATFSGGQPYRVVISNRPQIENVAPCAVQPGQTVELTIFGRNLPGGKPAPEWTIQGLPLEQIKVPFTMPADSVAAQRFDFRFHLSSPSLSARGVQVFPKGLENALNPATIMTATAPVTLEQEPNDDADKAQAVNLPTVICGRLDKPGDSDWYTFTAKRGEPIAVELLCERMEQPGDLFVIITDEKGAEVGAFDDHGINFNALAQANRDPVGVFQPPRDGKFRLLVQERYRNGGARYQYALRLGKPRPDFFPVAFPEHRVDPSCPLVRAGGAGVCEVCLNRWDGLRNFVTIEAEGLPAGVTCPPVHIGPQSQFANVVFIAAANAPEWTGAIRLKAWTEIDGKRLEREVRWCQRRWAIQNISSSRACREICLAVRPKAPYAVKLPAAPATVAAGAALEIKATVDRLWPDFKGKVQLKSLNPPNGFAIATLDVPADKTEANVKITVAANVPPGTYTLVLQGDAQVPFQRDAKSAAKPNVRVAEPSTPVTIVVTATAKK